MRSAVARVLDARSTVAIASLITLVLGLFFTFVWAPHPWGWQGIDQYHELAKALARGEPFGTTDVPWGYAYYAAFFYRLFGDRVWVPVLAQVIINTAAPLLLYRLAQPLVGSRTATLSALILGIFSFNTVYASTQASDAVCTVLFLCSLVMLARGARNGSMIDIAIGGLLSGLVPQFRPNMILLPAILAAGYVLIGRTRAHLGRAIVFSAMVTLALTPWIVRNYRLTNTFMPTSTHGGIQLWYGTLQVGPYLESRAQNPRSIFDTPPLPYTSISESPILISATRNGCVPDETPVLVYWTDANKNPQRLTASSDSGRVTFAIPPQATHTIVYYFIEAERRDASGTHLATTPVNGSSHPFVLFVDDRHLEDLDRHQDTLDIFDIVRTARRFAWQEPADIANDFDADGVAGAGDLPVMVDLLLAEPGRGLLYQSISDAERATLLLKDGSQITIPRQWRGLQTDLEVEGNLAGALASRWRLRSEIDSSAISASRPCPPVDDVRANTVFYRAELHMMRRYMALAMDNIGRDPFAFVAASAYRMVRLFIIRGSDDVHATQQFTGARLAYTAGTVLSAAYFLVFAAGAVIALRRRSALAFLLVPIVYVPLTICFVLTNMRYTITMQPLMFVFVAVALSAALGLDSPEASGGAASKRAAS
ncbi:MAG TPA: glycosyltransferase family 39 protein [Vicinamibacterales bacterium]|nr:glycosyltransferase family 39 protein [Vicinamibacterales bacterium]